MPAFAFPAGTHISTRRDGRLSRPWCEVALAEIRTCNLSIVNPVLYHTATSGHEMDPPGGLGVCMPMECDIFPSLLWHCWLGTRKGIRPVKKLDVGLLVVMIWLELCMTYRSSSPVVTTISIILCFHKLRLTEVHLEVWPLKWWEFILLFHVQLFDDDTSLVAIFPGPILVACTTMPPFWIFLQDDGVGGENWSYRTSKATVKLSPPTNQHPTSYNQDSLCHPTNRHGALKEKLCCGANFCLHCLFCLIASSYIYKSCIY